MNKTVFTLSLVAALSLAPLLPIHAQTQVSEQKATSGSASIPLKVNQGLNLKMPPGTKIYKGWIDDGSIVQIDGDRDFGSGVSLIHLISRKPGTTHLSLVTKDESGNESLYVFKLVSSHKATSPIVSITGRSVSSAGAQYKTTNASYSKASVQNEGTEIFQRGVELAIAQGLIAENSTFHKAINQFISQVDSGRAVFDAAKRTGLQPNVVEQLFSLGQSAPAPAVKKDDALTVQAEPVVPQRTKETNKLLARIEALEKRVGKIDKKVAQINQQQDRFLAKLNDLDSQQQVFAAKIEGAVTDKSPKARPIKLTLSVPESPAPNAVRQSDETVAMGGPIVEESYTSIQIANALRYGLTAASHSKIVPYGSYRHRQFNSMIRRTLRGQSVANAAKNSGISKDWAVKILELGKVNPAAVGF